MPAPRLDRFTVTEITQLIKTELEEAFPRLQVEGEISNARPAASGHLYFTLKDEDASLSAVMFRGRAAALDFAPEDGQLVIATGSISVYARRGNYQIIVERMQLAGEGRILAELERRKRKLADEGLFDPSRKKRLPVFPARVAVVTSPTGAALRDILRVLRRRSSGLDVVVCPTLVQGPEAAGRIARMVEIASRHRLGDVIIVARGGGSIEDLLPFSDEAVVRAVAASDVPVISAVGHEIDWALVDFASDHRAPTPSAAAEVVSAAREDLLRQVLDHGRTTIGAFAARLQRTRLLLSHFAPEELHRSYDVIAQPVFQEYDRLREELVAAIVERGRSARHALDAARRELQSCSPYDVLKRGYAVVRGADGSVLTDSSAAEPGDNLNIQLSRGRLDATVEETHVDREL